MRTARYLTLIVLPALALVAACADTAGPSSTASEAGARQCFRPAQVNGFNPQGDDVVYLRVGASDIYRAEILGTCSDIDFAQRVAIRSLGGGSWICQGMDAEFIVPGPLGRDRCPITSLSKLSDVEVEEYRRRR